MCKSYGMVHTPRMELRKAACWSLRSLPARAGGERGCFSRLSHHAAIPLLAIVLASAATGRLSAGEGKVWQAGNYSFSDEMGGFTIRAIAGTGTRDNPIVIEEELHSASPVTMVIRAAGAGLSPEGGGGNTGSDLAGNLATSALYLRIVTQNAGGQSWIEFEFELQEILHQAIVFGDGLSFDQRRENSDRITSSAFEKYNRDFEPYDRLRFIEGKVDPMETVEFEFALTDFTPRWEFFLVQDPRIPSS